MNRTLALLVLTVASFSSAWGQDGPPASPARRSRGSAAAPAPSRPRLTDHDFMFDCPLEVSSTCRSSCPNSRVQPDQSCRWRDFGCDFKICWGGRRSRVTTAAVGAVLDDPASYIVGTRPPLLGGVNFISVVRIVSPGVIPGLYLMSGRFVLDVPGLAAPAQARRLIQWAQGCALSAQEHNQSDLEANERSENILQVVSCVSGVHFRRYEPAPAAPRPTGTVAAPASRPQPIGGRDVWDDPMFRHLRDNRSVSIDHGRLTIQGVAVYSASADPEERERVMNALTGEERGALKSLYVRNSSRVVDEAEQRSPPGEHERYFYNDDTGEAELGPAPDELLGPNKLELDGSNGI